MARGATYKVQFKRRREGKTNYNKRYKLVDLDKTRMVVRITSNHTIAQLVKIGENGDETLVSATSKQLKEFNKIKTYDQLREKADVYQTLSDESDKLADKNKKLTKTYNTIADCVGSVGDHHCCLIVFIRTLHCM